MAQDRTGQQNAIRVISSLSAGGYSQVSRNVIGGIASVTSLTVTGISTFNGDVYIDGNLYITGSEIIDGGTY
jgi:hypothetical protein